MFGLFTSINWSLNKNKKLIGSNWANLIGPNYSKMDQENFVEDIL